MVKIAYLKDHEETVSTLGQWSFDAWSQYNPKATPTTHIEKFKKHCNINKLPLTVIALNEDEEVIGMCSLRDNDGIRPDLTPWLGSLYVTPSYRKKHVAEKLMEATKRIAKSMNYHELYLLTFEPKLNIYYLKHGWNLIGTDTLNKYEVSVMACEL